jgi:hypothetical protein
MGIGGPYEDQLMATLPFRQHYAHKNGWDLVNITSLDPRAACLEHIPFSQRTHLSKLLIPDLLRDRYDIVLFVEADTIIHPDAPCISTYVPLIPKGGFAGSESWLPQERRSVFGWQHSHYDPIKPLFGTSPPDIPDETRAHNGGVLLYKPREVADRWVELFDTYQLRGVTDEHLLSIFEVQQGRYLQLPREWNSVWYYTKARSLKWTLRNITVTRGMIKFYNRILWRVFPPLEKSLFLRHFDSAHVHHFAFEGRKVRAISEALIQKLRRRGYEFPSTSLRPAIEN